MQLTATARDINGGTLTGRAVTWSSSDESKARVSQTGLVTGIAAGSVTITATSEGVSGTITIVVSDIPAPQIAGVSPATLTPGIQATISGSNFDTNPADLTVTVAGVAVTVTNATTSELTVQLPATMPCQLTQDVAVSVTGVGGMTTRAHPLRVAQQRTVAVGELLVLGTPADMACNELTQATGRYAIAITNESRVPTSTISFEFRGLSSGGAAAVSPVGANARIPRSAALAAQAESRDALEPQLRRHAERHARWLYQERDLYDRLTGVRRVLRAQRSAMRPTGGSVAGAAVAARQAAPVPLEVGATTTLKTRGLDNCQTFTEVQARVVYVGTKSVILEANDSPLANTMDADYQALGLEYDQKMHQILLDNFGDPLAYDPQTDANGRIVMFFSKAVNDLGLGALGFVSICDLFPPTASPLVAGSNQAEIFYARVPTSSDNNYNSINTRVAWLRWMPGTIIHEAKHIVSHALRMATPEEVPLEESWLEEATAQAAIEFYARATYYSGAKAPWKGNATYANTMYCDVRPTVSSCNGQPLLIFDHMFALHDYYENIESKSFFNSVRDDSDVYGSGWLFTRWAADQYAADEAAFFRAVTTDFHVTGLANIEARTGQSFATLHPNFMMALYADDVPGLTPPAGARYTVASWNLRDMFAGMNSDFPSSAPQPFPLKMRGSFIADAAVIGGAASYIELSGTSAGPQVLALRASGGGALPAGTTLRLAILRVQ